MLLPIGLLTITSTVVRPFATRPYEEFEARVGTLDLTAEVALLRGDGVCSHYLRRATTQIDSGFTSWSIAAPVYLGNASACHGVR